MEGEPTPGDVASIGACQEWAQFWDIDGVAFFHYNSTTEECHLYRNLSATCAAVGAPAIAPSLDECPRGKVVIKALIVISFDGCTESDNKYNTYMRLMLHVYSTPPRTVPQSLDPPFSRLLHLHQRGNNGLG